MKNEKVNLVLRTLVLATFSTLVAANPLRDQHFARGASSTCLCMPGDACWPGKEDWVTLNASLSGRLVATVPLAHVCHDPTFDANACMALRAVWALPQTQ